MTVYQTFNLRLQKGSFNGNDKGEAIAWKEKVGTGCKVWFKSGQWINGYESPLQIQPADTENTA